MTATVMPALGEAPGERRPGLAGADDDGVVSRLHGGSSGLERQLWGCPAPGRTVPYPDTPTA